MLPTYALLTRRTVASVVTTLGALAIAPLSAQAASLNFSIEWFFGSLTGSTGTGSITYDDATLTSSGAEFIRIESLNFDLEGDGGVDYSYPSLPTNIVGSLAFLDGEYQGLDLVIEDLLTIYASSTPGESTAIYQADTAEPGAVNIGTLTPDSEEVPEPGNVVGLLALGAVGMGLRRRSRLSQDT